MLLKLMPKGFPCRLVLIFFKITSSSMLFPLLLLLLPSVFLLSTSRFGEGECLGFRILLSRAKTGAVAVAAEASSLLLGSAATFVVAELPADDALLSFGEDLVRCGLPSDAGVDDCVGVCR